ncbi:DNA-formamidopyrimidine glycosylase family protein [Flavobacterium sp. GT2N3]|uniref:DNA-formamidopyrimidine glycosylase family protein n=1 Tax=unclassified Flavobacterium TaxID=196869 RepID=UPI003AADF681
MPEGPSIVLVKEAVAKFIGEKIIAVSGNSKIDHSVLLDKKVIEFKSWGKHFLICMDGPTLRVHFLLFGSYTVDEKKPDRTIRLNLTFENGEINLYTCSVKYLEGDINQYYDWTADVMNDQWSKKKAKAKLKKIPDKLICDVLLEQDIFAGVGNIIKNEILYRVRVHPESLTGKIPTAKLNKLIDETRIYSFQFLEWKREYDLKKHWLAHTKKLCLRCNFPIIKKQTGVKKRRSFICTNCQTLYS